MVKFRDAQQLHLQLMHIFLHFGQIILHLGVLGEPTKAKVMNECNLNIIFECIYACMHVCMYETSYKNEAIAP